MGILVFLIIDSLVTFAAIYLARKIISFTIDDKWLILASIGTAVLSLIPSLGWVLSMVFLFWMLNKYSSAKIWPDLILIVVIGRLLLVFMVLPLFY